MGENQKVLCFVCSQPIHIDEFGGIVGGNINPRFVHNNSICLMEVAKKLYPENVV